MTFLAILLAIGGSVALVAGLLFAYIWITLGEIVLGVIGIFGGAGFATLMWTVAIMLGILLEMKEKIDAMHEHILAMNPVETEDDTAP